MKDDDAAIYLGNGAISFLSDTAPTAADREAMKLRQPIGFVHFPLPKAPKPPRKRKRAPLKRKRS